MGVVQKLRIGKKTVLRKNCEEVKIWHYIKILETKDLGYLVRSGKRPKESVLVDHMEKINGEFSKLRGTQNMTTQYDLISYREELIIKVNIVSALLDRLQTRVALNIIAPEMFEKLLKELKSWGFDLNRDNPLIDEIEIVASELKALQLTIDALTEELYPNKQEDEAEAKEISENFILDFHRMILVYAEILKKDKINIKKTSLVEFAAMEKRVQELSKPKTAA